MDIQRVGCLLSNTECLRFCCIIALREEYVNPYLCSGGCEAACGVCVCVCVCVCVVGVVVGLIHLQICVDIAVL